MSKQQFQYIPRKDLENQIKELTQKLETLTGVKELKSQSNEVQPNEKEVEQSINKYIVNTLSSKQ